MKYVVRLLGIEINNIKNVIHGEIEMPQNKKEAFYESTEPMDLEKQ